jgi:hypothetical protein
MTGRVRPELPDLTRVPARAFHAPHTGMEPASWLLRQHHENAP